MNMVHRLAALTLAFASASVVPASAEAPVPYGAPINLELAKRAIAAAAAEAKRNNWGMAIAVVDTGGALVSFDRMDNAQTGSVKLAIQKAQSAAGLRRSTKVFGESLAGGGGGLRLLGLQGSNQVEGGLPIVVEGKIIGAIGASGGTGQQDGQTAVAGLNALK